MATKKPISKPTDGLPEFKRVAIGLIREPKLAARATMSDTRMQELIESFKAIGQIEPITLETRDGGFEIVAGHRRYLAARSLGWTEIAAVVRPAGSTNSLAVMLHENLVREDLNPAEEALFMAQAREELQLDEAGLCDLFKRPAQYIANRFALLRGDPNIFSALQRGEIRVGVAHELNRITAEDMRSYYLDVARRGDPPARVVHQWVEQWKMGNGAISDAVRAGKEAAAANAEAAGAGGNGTAAEVQTAGAFPGGDKPFFGCALCGGDRDPYNLVTVQIHKWEWEQILAQVAKAARGE